ncbi:MAG TPA: carbonic anhydrase [Solirubrobacteraceae bacterium]|jgi:carbonic anhydrase|nr:carbonic anhydrase [Solirubrobacteraceae bacterium]
MSKQLSRRGFLKSAGLGMAVAAAEPAIASAASVPEPRPRMAMAPGQALQLLIAGNRRWVTGTVTHPHQSVGRREALRHVQHPFATIVSRIDSRVPPELVFDRGIGDMAVIRTGAQVLDDGVVLGSVEFSCDHLHTPLVPIMGHQRCGAVEAAIRVIQSGSTAPGPYSVGRRRPSPGIRRGGQAAGRPGRQHGESADDTRVRRLRTDPLIHELIAHGKLVVRGAYYSLGTGVCR